MSPSTLPADSSTVSEAEPEDEDIVLAVHRVSKHYKLWASPSVRLHYSLLSQAHRTLRKALPPESGPVGGQHRRRGGG